MVIADYPFLGILWSTIVFFAWVAWIWMLIGMLGDVFRRRDIGGWSKAAWVVFLIAVPFLGVLTYLIAQHDGMAERNLERAQAQQRQMDDYVRSASTHNGAADEIAKAKQLYDSGAISEADYGKLRDKALSAA